VLSLLLVLAVTLCGSAVALAGDGSGDNRDQPITVVHSSLEDGAVIDGDTLSVHLEFNKNVVHISVRQNNMTRFALYNERGERQPLEVIMGDEQVDPSVKRLVDLKATGLQPGTYTLVIEKGLMAKNGTELDRDITFRFTVAGAPAGEPAPADTLPADEAQADTPPVEQAPADGAPTEEAPAGQPPTETSPAGEPAQDKPSAGGSAAEEPAQAAKLETAKPGATATAAPDQPPAGEPASTAGAAPTAAGQPQPGEGQAAAGVDTAGREGGFPVWPVVLCAAVAVLAAGILLRKGNPS